MSARARAVLLACGVAAWLTLGVVTPARGEAPGGCASPRAAAASVFDWQQPGRVELARAAACLDPAGKTPDELEAAAVLIKRLYDERALWVDMEALSDDPAFRDAESGVARAAVHPELPQVVVVRADDGSWRWSADSIAEVLRLHERSAARLSDVVERALPRWLATPLLGVAAWKLLALGLILVAALGVRAVVRLVVAARVAPLAQRAGNRWVIHLVDVIGSPAATLAMAAMLAAAHPVLSLPIHASLAVATAVKLLVGLSLVLALYKLADVLGEFMQERAEKTETKLDDQLVPLVRKGLKAAIALSGFLVFAQNVGVNATSLLAGLSIVGLGVSLAAKDTIANFFGSVMIFIDKPFQIGDWVVVDGVEGVVEEVGFRSTRIRTFYRSLVTVPNARFIESKVDNLGARDFRRTTATLGLTYDSSPEQIQAFTEGVRAILLAHPATRKDLFEVHFSAYGSHSLDVMLYYFVKAPNWSLELRAKHEINLAILRLAADLGVRFAFPTQTLHVESLAALGSAPSVPPALGVDVLRARVNGYAPGGVSSGLTGRELTEGYFPEAPTVDPSSARPGGRS